MNYTSKKYDSLIFDVGMHGGEDTEYYLKKGFNVVGFEADPDLINYCKSKFAKEIREKRLIIVEGAIVDPSFLKDGGDTVNFYKNLGFSDWGTIKTDWAKRNEILGTQNVVIKVKIVDFIECLDRFGIPYYMKIDIEGSDIICLQALSEFSNKPNFISIESNKVDFKRIKGEIRLFEELGYSEFKAIQQENITCQIVPNPSREGNYVEHKFQEESSGLFGEELPGHWKNKLQILREYKIIFLKYRYFGDYSFLKRSRVGKSFIKGLGKMLKRPIPGWYDTHAKFTAKT